MACKPPAPLPPFPNPAGHGRAAVKPGEQRAQRGHKAGRDGGCQRANGEPAGVDSTLSLKH
eukprot:358131-Chlamydomonas_euryale.AAC.3